MDVPGNRNSSQAPLRGARAPTPGRRAHLQPPMSNHANPPVAGQRSFAPIDTLDDAIGVERLEGFSFRKFFSEVFKVHSPEEVESIFACGGSNSSPDIGEIKSAWPTPFVFGQVFLGTLVIFLILQIAYHLFENSNLLPGLMCVGSFMMPLSMVVLFFELNVWRNVSICGIAPPFIRGGVLALFFSLFLFSTTLGSSLDNSVGASSAGVIEEIGKVIALVWMVDRRRYPRKLNGLLFGAAVGAGFAAFESAGYAFNIFLLSGIKACIRNIEIRGLLSPFGHIVWTAIAGGALWRANGDGQLRISTFFSKKFLKVFFVPVALHMLWNCSYIQLPFLLNYVIIGIVGWSVALSLVQEGLREVAEQKAAVCSRRAMPDVVINGKKQTLGSMALAAGAFIVATFFTGFLIAAGSAFFSKIVMPAGGSM